jgi:putative inorganic carbon (hco3(-)) transporter
MENWLARASFYLTFASAVSILVSIAASQILLGLAVAALLLAGIRLRFPPIKLPLGLFFLGTVISLAFSADPMAGRPQIRKFFVFLILLVASSTLTRIEDLRRLNMAWFGVAAIAGARSLFQFWQKLEAARRLGRGFYDYYVSERITGFMGHWMTFGGLEMIVLLMLAAFLLFATPARRWVWLWLGCAALISAGLVLGFTRSIWIATAAAGLYLMWHWKKWLVAVVPLATLAGIWIAPGPLKERAVSVLEPKVRVDSNQHRIVTWRTGWEMIKAHPWLGVGPEHVKLHFDEYVPRDIPRPLPEGWYGHLHNIYLHYAAERGIPTMLALMWMLGKILWDFLRALRRIPPGARDARFLLHGGVAVMIAILVAGFFELNLGDSEVLFLFLTVVAAGYTAAEQTLHRENPTGLS